MIHQILKPFLLTADLFRLAVGQCKFPQIFER